VRLIFASAARMVFPFLDVEVSGTFEHNSDNTDRRAISKSPMTR
jgi:hypothetical protein